MQMLKKTNQNKANLAAMWTISLSTITVSACQHWKQQPASLKLLLEVSAETKRNT